MGLGRALAGVALMLVTVSAWAGLDEVKTKSGRVKGTLKDGVVSFKGIPFATAPIGALRWRAPQPIASWKGVRDADHFSASCYQQIVNEMKPWTYEFMTHTDVSEDCLYLNVWTEEEAIHEKRPVFVYIYGGALTSGSGAVPVYDGAGLARKDLVVVTFNYRVGVFGFFAHPELTKESGHNASGNYGFMDQAAALQWVHDNISAFGGDPERVTIAGQSAGAASVHALTASPLAKGLFQRAIAESGSSVGGMGLMGAKQLPAAEEDGVKLAEAKGVKTLAELRALSADKIFTPGMRFGAVVDGYFLPASVGEIFVHDRQNDVPTLTGLTADDLVMGAGAASTVEEWQKQARSRFGDVADEFLKLYPASSNVEVAQMTKESGRDQGRVSMYLWALNRAKTAKTAAFTYYWNHTMPGPDAARFGAFHTSEVPYVLHTLYMSDRPFTDVDRQVEEMMSSYWVNFATNGDPNGQRLPVWPAVSADSAMTMQVGDNSGPIAIAGNGDRVEFWKKFFGRQIGK